MDEANRSSARLVCADLLSPVMESVRINLFRHGWASLALRCPGLRSHPSNAPWFRDLCRSYSKAVMHRDRLRLARADAHQLGQYEEICDDLEKEVHVYLSLLNPQS
ncbi:hypothetical protein NXC24_PC01778 (plasmid) [Rhizobium sp. NXC24]|nr:hypothetical protein NXC24_PC01778 [Rhizobium sp. NXC24]